MIEQITYLTFIKRLDEMQELEERKAITLIAVPCACERRSVGASLRQPSADAHILMVKRRRCHSFPFAAGVSASLSATLTQSRELVKAAKGLK